MISCHDMISCHNMISCHDMTSFHDMVPCHDMISCHQDMISCQNMLSRQEMISCHDMISWYHVMTWCLRNPGPWTMSPSEFTSSYFEDLKLHTTSTISNYLCALMQFDFKDFAGFYSFSRMLGGKNTVWSLTMGSCSSTCYATERW